MQHLELGNSNVHPRDDRGEPGLAEGGLGFGDFERGGFAEGEADAEALRGRGEDGAGGGEGGLCGRPSHHLLVHDGARVEAEGVDGEPVAGVAGREEEALQEVARLDERHGGCRFSPVALPGPAERGRRQMSPVRPHIGAAMLRAFLDTFLAPVRPGRASLGPKTGSLLRGLAGVADDDVRGPVEGVVSGKAVRASQRVA